MSNRVQGYSFEFNPKPMGRVREKTSGPFDEIFEYYTFKGALERIVLEFTINTRKHETGLAFPGMNTPQSFDFDYLSIVYKAFGRPRRRLLWETSGLIALISTNLTLRESDRDIILPTQFVNFAVSEADALAKAYHMRVHVIYHGDPAHAKQYLPERN